MFFGMGTDKIGVHRLLMVTEVGADVTPTAGAMPLVCNS